MVHYRNPPEEVKDFSTLEEKIFNAITIIEPKAYGTLTVVAPGTKVRVFHDVKYPNGRDAHDLIVKIINEMYPEFIVERLREPNEGLHVKVINDSRVSPNRPKGNASPDKVNIVYYGYVHVNNLIPNPHYKRETTPEESNILGSILALEFITPIIVDTSWNIIDGNQRYYAARRSKIREVPIMMIDVTEQKADYLRIVLNRSSEFQKWFYHDYVKTTDTIYKGTDSFADKNPQLQPLLEPLGIFGQDILPVSFFGDTILKYIINENDEIVQSYSQEIGLEEWSKIQRERIMNNHMNKRSMNNLPQDRSKLTSLFNLSASEKDFVQQEPLYEIMNNTIHETKEMAKKVSQEYENEREKKTNGGRKTGHKRTSIKEKKNNYLKESNITSIPHDKE